MERLELTVYTGIADSEGLDSLIQGKEVGLAQLHMMDLRCRMNSHRHGIVFRAFMNKQDDPMLMGLWDAGKYRQALEFIKKNAIQVETIGKNMEERWASLPHYPSQKIEIEQDTDQMSLDLETEEE